MARDIKSIPAEEAAMMLAGILTSRLGVEVSAMKLHDAIRDKWSLISPLAHAIHGKSETSLDAIEATLRAANAPTPPPSINTPAAAAWGYGDKRDG